MTNRVPKLDVDGRRAAQVRKRQDLFLKAFARTGTINGAAVKAKIDRETVRLWRKNDPAFEQRFQDADLDLTGMLEDSAVDDALGVLDEKTGRWKGGDVVTRIFLLKSRKPLVYRDQVKVEHAGEIHTTPGPDLSKMTKAELLALAGMTS